METNQDGSIQEPSVPAEQNDLSQAIDQAIEDQVVEEGAPATEPEVEQPELSVDDYKKQIEQLKKEKEHWEKTVSRQGEEVGRLRKLEKTLYELNEQDRKLAEQEAANEYDTDKLVDIRADRKNIQNQTKLANLEVLKAQVIQRVPDFEELVSSGYVKEAVLTVAKASGMTPSDADINLAIENIRSNPVQAITIATTARANKKIAELTNRQQTTKKEINSMAKKVTAANENTIVTNGKTPTPKYTVDQIRAMTPEQREQIIEAGRKNGSLYKK